MNENSLAAIDFREYINRIEQDRRDTEQRVRDTEQRVRDDEQRIREDRELLLTEMREMKHDNQVREQRIEAGFKELSNRVESLKWWVISVCLATVVAVATMVMSR